LGFYRGRALPSPAPSPAKGCSLGTLRNASAKNQSVYLYAGRSSPGKGAAIPRTLSRQGMLPWNPSQRVGEKSKRLFLCGARLSGEGRCPPPDPLPPRDAPLEPFATRRRKIKAFIYMRSVATRGRALPSPAPYPAKGCSLGTLRNASVGNQSVYLYAERGYPGKGAALPRTLSRQGMAPWNPSQSVGEEYQHSLCRIACAANRLYN
jgi:hypothetical protein